VLVYPENPCIKDEYNYSKIHGFTLCYEKTIKPEVAEKLVKEATEDLAKIHSLFLPKVVKVLQQFRLFALKQFPKAPETDTGG